MRNKITISEPDVVKDQRIKTSDRESILFPELSEKKSKLEIIASESSDDFVNYIEWLGLSKDPNLVVLSSEHHYFYDAEEMKSVRTVVNLVGLNQIRQVPDFVSTIFHLLPSKSYFVGCFTDNRKRSRFSLIKHRTPDNQNKDQDDTENGISSRVPIINMLYNLLDSRINRHLSGRTVKRLFTEHGFKVLDMTELNGLTYFCAQKNTMVVR